MRLARSFNDICLRLALIGALSLVSLTPGRAQEPNPPFGIRTAYVQLVDGVYLLSARLHLPLNGKLREALKDGVPLTLELELEVNTSRRFWLDEGVASLRQRYQLQYDAVSDRYLVRNLNSAQQTSFPTLDDAQVATLGKFGTRRVLRDGEHLFKAGDREYKFFVVERGAVEIVEHSSGETKRVALHERHAFGGDVSLVTGRPALISAIALIASLVVLVSAAVAAALGAVWQPLLLGGGGVALVSLAALGWSAWRLTHITWPTETLKSFEENWRWLAAQLRSRLTLRSHAA